MVAAEDVNLEVGETLDLTTAGVAVEATLLGGPRVFLAKVGRDSR